MCVTLSYDLTDVEPNERTYLRSMLERFAWKRRGGSVFRYEDDEYDDWLNRIVPSLMFFRSYIVAHGITLTRFTIDANSTSFIDTSDETDQLGSPPCKGGLLPLVEPTNTQSAEALIREFVDAAIEASKPH